MDEKKHPYSLQYIRQKNQGKHIAFNTALSQATSEWFICVDSDDELTSEAVAMMNDDLKNIPDGCVGVVYPRRLNGFDNEAEWKSIDKKKVDIIVMCICFTTTQTFIPIYAM